MKRKNCPACQKRLPIFLFSANRRITADKEGVTFTCPSCQSTLRAHSNDAHQRNFILIFLVPLLISPAVIYMHSFVPSKFRIFYYLAIYTFLITHLVLSGQHKMDITVEPKA